MGQAESLLQFLDYRQQCRTFILVSLVDLIPDGVPACSNEQSKHHLRILVLAVLGVAGNADLVLLGLKIERTCVIKRHRHLSAHDCPTT